MIPDLPTFIDQSQKQPIINGWGYIKWNYFRTNVLVHENNPLSDNATAAIKNHFNATAPLTAIQINTYVTASSISHLIDAWGYLSSSISSLLNGNKSVSIHLAYYSELRAAMSFLASEGVGVFHNKHLGIFSDTVNDYYNKSLTHDFAWEALEQWCNSPSKSTLDLLKIFKVKGKDFSDITTGFVGATTATTSTIIKRWLLNWAFDIMKYKEDRRMRNFVSYCPQSGQGFDELLSFKNTIKNVYDYFYALSPLGSDPFHLLDRFLLKNLFVELGTHLGLDNEALKERINKTFEDLGITLDASLKSLLFSEPPYDQEHSIFSESNKRITDSFPIIARGTLLLRVVTGKISLLLNEARVNKDELQFIWHKYGFNNGFWRIPYAIDEFYKLWVEIEQTYNDLTSQMNPMSDVPYIIKSGVEEDINRLTQFNRAALWGL